MRATSAFIRGPGPPPPNKHARAHMARMHVARMLQGRLEDMTPAPRSRARGPPARIVYAHCHHAHTARVVDILAGRARF